MNKNEDKHIEKMVDSLMKDRALDTPSFDFTSKVMSQVLATKTSDITTYRPLISKNTLIIICGVILAFIGYGIFYDNSASNNQLPHFDFIPHFDSIPFISLTKSLQFSTATIYSVVLTALMLFIQIPLLKNYYDSKFNA